MKIYGRRSSDFFTILMLGGLAIVWMLLAPTQLGGQATYVIISGNSMEPNFHLGDLAIVRQAGSYQIGDVVTYKNAQLGEKVIHRIIGLDAEHFIIKGDNNSWVDSYHPVQDEILGKLWIYLPGIGKIIEWARGPINLAMIAAIMGGLIMASTFTGTPQQGKNANKQSANLGGLEVTLSTLGILALVFIALGIFAFTQPLLRSADNLPYQQVGIFFYSAAGTQGVYDSDTVHSGEPIFPKLTCSLNLGFAYNLAGAQLQNLSGMQQLSAQITDDQSGWQRTIQLKPAAAFSGASFSTSATLDLCQIEALVAAVEQETGFHPGTYTLVIFPDVTATGTLAGQPFHDSFEPRLVFKFDKVHFYLNTDQAQIDPLHFSKDGSMSGAELQDNTVAVLGLKPRVIDLRMLSAFGFCLSLVAGLVAGLAVYGMATKSQERFIHMKYGALLVDVFDRGLETLVPVIDVATIDDLAKIAERQNAMILHMSRDFLHFYFVQGSGGNATTYRYVVNDGKNGPIKPDGAGHKSIK